MCSRMLILWAHEYHSHVCEKDTVRMSLSLPPFPSSLSCLLQSFPGFGVSDRDASSQGWALINDFLALWRVLGLCITIYCKQKLVWLKPRAALTYGSNKRSEGNVTLSVEHNNRSNDRSSSLWQGLWPSWSRALHQVDNTRPEFLAVGQVLRLSSIKALD